MAACWRTAGRNVRELFHVCSGGVLSAASHRHAGAGRAPARTRRVPFISDDDLSLHPVARLEKALIVRALERAKGNRSRPAAARHRTPLLYAKLEEHGIARSDTSEPTNSRARRRLLDRRYCSTRYWALLGDDDVVDVRLAQAHPVARTKRPWCAARRCSCNRSSHAGLEAADQLVDRCESCRGRARASIPRHSLASLATSDWK